MRELALVILLLALPLATESVPPSNGPDNTLCFSVTDAGLPWPVTSPRDVGQLLGHGMHCVEMLEQYQVTPPANPIDLFHQQHCARLVGRMIQEFGNFTAPPLKMCSAMRSLQNTALWDAYAYVTYNYFDTTSLGSERERERETYKQLKLLVPEGTPTPQSDLFGLSAGNNLGDVLAKAEFTPQELTRKEKELVDGWNSEEVVYFGAVGVYCQSGDRVPFARLRDAIRTKANAATSQPTDALGRHHHH